MFLNLALGSHTVEDLVGVVHNCTAHEEGYRLGILFRIESKLQLDAPLIRQLVERMYRQSQGPQIELATA